ASRKRIYEVVSILGWLKNTQPAFSTSNYTYNVGTAVKLYKVSDASLNAVVVGNFNVRTDSIIPTFQHTGVWYEIFTRDSIMVTDVQQKIVLNPGEYKFYTDKKLISPTVLTSNNNIHKKEASINVYPNPFSDELFLECSNSEESINI